MNLSNAQIVAGIVSKDRQIINQVYLKYLPMVTRMVKSNSGNENDAMDIFQDGLLVLYEKLNKTEDPNSIQCGAYLNTVCKNLWLMKIRSKKIAKGKETELMQENPDLDTEIIDDMVQTQKYELYRRYFKKLSPDCQNVLTLFLQKTSLKKIAEQMGFSEQYAKKKKYTCQKSLIQAIEKDQLYAELIKL